MSKSRKRATLYGSLGGGLLGLATMVLLGGRYAMGSVTATPVVEGTARATTEFVVSTGGIYLSVIVAAILAGLLIAGIAYAIGREEDPDAARFPLRYMMATAAIVSAATAYALIRAGLGAFSDIEAGFVTIPVLQMTLVSLVAGILTGGLTADVVDRLAHPRLLGIEGVAVPESGTALVREMSRAVGLPIVALVVAAVVAVPLSQVLLAFHGTAAIAIFSLIAAAVLGGAALLAYRPWAHDEDHTAA